MRRFHEIRKTQEGRAMLNLGCGSRTHWEWNNIDFSPYARMAHHKRLATALHCIGFLSDYRYERVLKVDPDIIDWDICRGIPFDDYAFDVVYHSHFITHLDREIAARVIRECHRVLKPEGILRVVIPDLQEIVRAYNEAVEAIIDGDPQGQRKHEEAVDELFELMVRKNACGTSLQSRPVCLIERLVRGDISRTGELRRWHYDRYSLGAMMRATGFREILKASSGESRIQRWNEFGLDIDDHGCVHKPGSLYMEGVK